MPTYRMGRAQPRMAFQSGAAKMEVAADTSPVPFMPRITHTTLAMVAHTAATKNCTQLSLRPSTVAVKWSITRMWMAKHTAHTSTSRSPGASEKSPLMHSRYSATTLHTTAIQVDRFTFRLKNRPNTGTSTTYRAVMKPALPASVPAARPACWKLEATASAVPQQMPPNHIWRLAAFRWMAVRLGLSLLTASKMTISTSSAATAI